MKKIFLLVNIARIPYSYRVTWDNGVPPQKKISFSIFYERSYQQKDLPNVDVNLDFSVSMYSITILGESINLQSEGNFPFFLGQDIISQGSLKQMEKNPLSLHSNSLSLLSTYLEIQIHSWGFSSSLAASPKLWKSHLEVHTSWPWHCRAVLPWNLWQPDLLQQQAIGIMDLEFFRERLWRLDSDYSCFLPFTESCCSIFGQGLESYHRILKENGAEITGVKVTKSYWM